MELNKYKKQELYNNVCFHFLVKEHKEINDEIHMYKKKDLIKLMIENNIEYKTEEELCEETRKIEKHNQLKTKILFNYLLNDNENIDIYNLDEKTNEELEDIIIKNNLIKEPINDQYNDLNNILISIIKYNMLYNDENKKIENLKVKNIIKLLL